MALQNPANDTVVKPAKAPPPTKAKATATQATSGGRSAAGGYTATTWAQELLKRGGWPITPANVKAIVSWEAAEGGHWNNTATYNPLNATQDEPGAHPYEAGKSVKAYASWDDGFAASIQTIKAGDFGFPAIDAALSQGTDPNAVTQAVVNSSWGTKKITVGGHTDYGNGAAYGGGSVDPALSAGKPLTVKDYLSSDVDSQYGYLSAFLKNKEIGPIIAKAAKNGWTEGHMLAELETTNWWKKTSQTARTWEATKRTDPATAQQQLTQMRGQIRQLAKSTLGHQLSDDQINHMANTAIAANWSQAELQKAVGAEFTYTGAQQTYQGAAGQTVTQLQSIAKQYVVPLSTSTLQTWAKQILEGTYTTDDFQSYVQQQAESLYPTLKSALKSGQTTTQYADPYLQVASQILEKPAESFDLSSPQWNKALLQPQPDGERTAMPLSDWADYLRSLPAYQQTDQAKGAAADFSLALANEFGKVSTGYQGSLSDTAINYGST